MLNLAYASVVTFKTDKKCEIVNFQVFLLLTLAKMEKIINIHEYPN